MGRIAAVKLVRLFYFYNIIIQQTLYN